MGSPGGESRGHCCEEHLYCCGAATEVLKFGVRDLRCSRSRHSAPCLLFLVIPGNPGMVGFYRTFMETLYQAFEGRYPVWAVSHAGHCVPPDTMDMLEDVAPVQTGDVFGLQGQIEHKLAFLREHVPRDTRLVLIGHSIGCYIILDMMKREPRLQVLKSVLLFPTIERMAATPQGRLMTPVLCRLRYATYLPVFLLSLLPLGLKTSIVKFALRGLSSLDPKITNAAVRLLSVDCVANAMYMGSQEMVQVLERDSCTIGQNLDKLVFYYGATDHWCPVQYYQDIKRDFPDGNIQLCSRGFRHAFVLDSGREVAAMAAKWLRDDLQGL
ncbi:lipid droplet-associated hydrolase isoform X1 [Scleropages formosus]|uniref:lipid droplet-associated hydrolase isoform X1 n=2 Tax=Scleropages formosus TaxID=113540 RepID=UPI0010FA905A|nr:lipid droplet-associated hydrolase isoform X1 [Scleropages formosus]